MAEVDELMKMYRKMYTLNPRELTNFRSLIQARFHKLISMSELIRDLGLLFKPEDNLHDPKIDEKPKQNPTHNLRPIRGRPRIRFGDDDVTNHGFGKIDLERQTKGWSEAKQKLDELFKAIEERLSTTSEMRMYTSLCKDFNSKRLSYGKFVTCLLSLIEKYKDLYQRFKEIAYDEVGEDCLSDPKIETGPEIRVKVGDENPQEFKSDKINLEGKNKRRILFPKDSNQLKKRRTSKRFELVTPSYRLIPEELRTPVLSSELNNTCVLRKYYIEGGKKLTGIEEEMKACEDHMYEVVMWKEALWKAVERAEKVMRGEMKLEDLGVNFYRCLEMLYGGDVFEFVTEDHQRALPVVLKRLKQKLDEIMDARKSWKPIWKQTFKRLSAKPKDSIAQKSQVDN